MSCIIKDVTLARKKKEKKNSWFPAISLLFLPVSINEAGIDVVGSFQASDWLQADACGLVGHDVDQPVLELVAGKVGTDEA